MEIKLYESCEKALDAFYNELIKISVKNIVVSDAEKKITFTYGVICRDRFEVNFKQANELNTITFVTIKETIKFRMLRKLRPDEKAERLAYWLTKKCRHYYDANHRPKYLKKGDRFFVAGIQYAVAEENAEGMLFYWPLSEPFKLHNDEAFDVLGLNKHGVARKFDYWDRFWKDKLFPETNDVKKMTNLVNYLFDIEQGIQKPDEHTKDPCPESTKFCLEGRYPKKQ